jgi:hypothetical protein
MTENRGQRTEDRKQRSEVRGQRSDNRGQIFEVGSRNAEVGIIRNTEVEKAMDRIEHGAWGRAFCAVSVF